jgi:aspartate kinase
MFTPLDGTLAFSLGEEQMELASEVLDSLDVPYEVRHGLTKVTVVGAGMHGVPGVMAHVAEALLAAGVEILQVADSHYTISVLVEAPASRRAISALHAAFGLGVE